MQSTRTKMLCMLSTLTLLIVIPYVIHAVSPINRDSDPVVFCGLDLPHLIGADPDSVLAFRWEGAWSRIPVQIDERAVVDYGQIYNESDMGVAYLVYADTSTWTGADPDSTFDNDDELVFMATDVGYPAPWDAPAPAGTIADSKIPVSVLDPLDSAEGYVYLFISDGASLPPLPNYLSYTFLLDSGDYKTTYGLLAGPNPENSEVTTPYYRTHFSDRWIRDEVNVFTGTATGDDILDRHKNLFAPGNCGRSEDTFSAGEGCFVANISGPVRAIRSYLGCNSGPFTQRTHIFYERRHDVTTFLRVHAISGVMDFYDYSPDAAGMTYYNDLNQSGVPVDGSSDAVTAGSIIWEMVSGPRAP